MEHETEQHETEQHETEQHETEQHETEQHETEQHETEQLKSEKKPQKKLRRILWILEAIILIVIITVTVIDYDSYKNGQQFGIEILKIYESVESVTGISSNDSYDKQLEKAYHFLGDYREDYNLSYGITISRDGERQALNNVKESIYNAMKVAGFNRYPAYRIEKWFEYTNYVDFCINNPFIMPFVLLFILSLIFVLIFTIISKQEEKKEVIILGDSVICKTNSKKSIELSVSDIKYVMTPGRNSLTIAAGKKAFTINHINNPEELKTAIMEMKEKYEIENPTPEISEKFQGTTPSVQQVSTADELKKFKDLLDSDVITQEEFDAKKKQLLGL